MKLKGTTQQNEKRRERERERRKTRLAREQQACG